MENERWDKTREVLQRVAAQWDKTEGLIKQAELVGGEVCTAAIFELRYAGRRLIDGNCSPLCVGLTRAAGIERGAIG